MGDFMYIVDDENYGKVKLNFDLSKYSIIDLLNGMNVESEHGTINIDTNVTDDDVIKTAKIAIAHLNEFPNYYNEVYGIKKFEEFLKNKLND